MQRVFGDPGSPWAAPRFGEITGPVRALAGAFAPRVSFTRFIAPARPQGAWQEYYRQWPFALQPPDAELWQLAGGLADGLPGEPAGREGDLLRRHATWLSERAVCGDASRSIWPGCSVPV
jgi:hypothetical protein